VFWGGKMKIFTTEQIVEEHVYKSDEQILYSRQRKWLLLSDFERAKKKFFSGMEDNDCVHELEKLFNECFGVEK
jgi:hypothetical protein